MKWADISLLLFVIIKDKALNWVGGEPEMTIKVENI